VLPKNIIIQEGAINKGRKKRKEETDLGVAEWRIPVGTHRERGEPEGREGDAGRGSNSDEKEKEERCGENKK
jgi:hypothetical protein